MVRQVSLETECVARDQPKMRCHRPDQLWRAIRLPRPRELHGHWCEIPRAGSGSGVEGKLLGGNHFRTKHHGLEKKPDPRKQVRRHPGEQIRKEMFQAAGVLILKGADAFQRLEARHPVEGEVVGRVKPSTRPARRSWRASTSPSSVFSACSPMPGTACGSSAAKPAAQVQESACTIFAGGSPERCSGGLRHGDNRLGRTQLHVADRDHAAQNSVSNPNVSTIEREPSRRGIIR